MRADKTKREYIEAENQAYDELVNKEKRKRK